MNSIPRIVVIGAGFGGLQAAKKLSKLPVHVTLIDRNNHHTFQPFLYQVALTLLSPAQVATPLRPLFRGQKNVDVIMGEVTSIDVQNRRITADGIEFQYDYLIVAAGARHSYFGRNEWEKNAPGLKTLEDALELRRRILLALELAERNAVAVKQSGKSAVEVEAPTLVVIGGGPTGVEMAGALASLIHKAGQDFRGIDTNRVKVVLVAAGDRVLPSFREEVSRSAERQLRELGVDVRTNSRVTSVEDGVVYIGEQVVPAAVTVWASGVAPSPLAKQLSSQLDKGGRVVVEADLSLPSHPEVFAIGDMAACKDDAGAFLPGLASVAEQQGVAVADSIRRDIQGRARQAFRYRDYGSMATIGKNAAVVQWGPFHLTRSLAWVTWAAVHAMLLLDFRTRSSVLREWAWSLLTSKTSASLITGSHELSSRRQQQPGIVSESLAK